MAIQNVELPMGAIEAFCRKHRIVEFALFGSVLRSDFRSDSDVDVLVTFAEDSERSLLDEGRDGVGTRGNIRATGRSRGQVEHREQQKPTSPRRSAINGTNRLCGMSRQEIGKSCSISYRLPKMWVSLWDRSAKRSSLKINEQFGPYNIS